MPNPMLDVPDEDLFARVREHTDGICDREIDELERRLIVLYFRVYQLRQEAEAQAA